MDLPDPRVLLVHDRRREDPAAGHEPETAVGPGTTVRVLTGGMLPPGADAVVKVEDTDAPSGVSALPQAVAVRTAVEPGRDVRLAGSDGLAIHDRRHFYALASRMMRRHLVDRARRRDAAKRGGDGGESPSAEPAPLDACRQMEALDVALADLATVDDYLEAIGVAAELRISRAGFEADGRHHRSFRADMERCSGKRVHLLVGHRPHGGPVHETHLVPNGLLGLPLLGRILFQVAT